MMELKIKEFVTELDGNYQLNDSYKYTYEDYVIRENMLWNYKVWEQLGFLTGLEGDVKDRCAFAYEQMTQYLVSIDEEECNERWKETYTTIIFPIIKKIITRLGDEGKEALYTFDKLRQCEEKIGKEHYSLIYPMSEIEDAYPFGSYGVDIEAEFASMIADTFASAIIEGDLDKVNYLEKQSYIDLIKAIDIIDHKAKTAIKEITKEVFSDNK